MSLIRPSDDWAPARSLILVECLGSDVGAVRPRNRAPFQEETSKVVRVPQGFEYGTVEPLAEINGLFGVVVERQVDAVAAAVLSAYHGWQKGHGDASLEGLYPLQGTARLHVLPVRLKLPTMQRGPLPDEAKRRVRPDVSNTHLPVQIELPLLSLVLGMEVSWLMLLRAR